MQEGHSHVRLGRIQYENNSGLDYFRDVNEVFHFDARATRNPRVSFSYDYAEGKDPFPRPEIEDPYSGWDRIPQSGWVNRPPSFVDGGITEGSATEILDKAPGENVNDHTASGYFEVTDADLSDSISVSAAAQGAGYLGTFTPTVASQTTGGSTGRVEWEFKVNDADLDHRAEGQTVVQQYVVPVDDGHGGTATETVTVTITGSNDAPEIHVRSGDSDAESLDETDTTLTASGTLSLLDVDVIDEVTARVDSVTKGGPTAGPCPPTRIL